MTGATGLQMKFIQETRNFQKTMDELRLLKLVSRDLQKFKKMAQLKKFD